MPGYNSRANDSNSKMKAASRKWSPRSADYLQHLATLRERRQEARRMKWKDSSSEVVCHVILALGEGSNTSLMSAAQNF